MHSKEEILKALYITEEQIENNKSDVLQKLFCCAVLRVPVEHSTEILNHYTLLRNTLYPIKDKK